MGKNSRGVGKNAREGGKECNRKWEKVQNKVGKNTREGGNLKYVREGER